MVGRTKIADLLKTLLGYGEVKATELLNRARIKPDRVRGLQRLPTESPLIDVLTDQPPAAL